MTGKKIIAGGGDSFLEAVRNMQNDIEIRPSREKCLFVIADKDFKSYFNEDETTGKDYERYLFRGESGGTIVFSTDVNGQALSDNFIKKRIPQIYETAKNRIFARRILDKIRRKHEIQAWTIGRYLTGTYTGKNDKTYNEKSICVDCIGISKDTLFRVVKELKSVFKQESVLIKHNHQIYLVE